MYTLVHKGLRAFMSDVLVTVGRLDGSDDADVADALAKVRQLVEICRDHLFHENNFLHTAMNARRPGSASAAANQHVDQEEAFDQLQGLVLAVERSDGRDMARNILRLYRSLALFLAHNLEHMELEEGDNQATLWDAYSDEELLAIHKLLLASVAPERMRVYLRWILPNATHAERFGILNELQFAMPQNVFEGVLQMVRRNVPEKEWIKLDTARTLAAVSI
jgi:hypothetical protein